MRGDSLGNASIWQTESLSYRSDGPDLATVLPVLWGEAAEGRTSARRYNLVNAANQWGLVSSGV